MRIWNPFLPKEPEQRSKFIAVFSREIRVYRKRPSFWGGMSAVVIFTAILFYRLDLVSLMLLMPIVGGLALVHDTITSHFVGRIVELEPQDEIPNK